MKDKIRRYILDSGADAAGFASVDRFDGADEAHHYWLKCHECLKVCPLNR